MSGRIPHLIDLVQSSIGWRVVCQAQEELLMLRYLKSSGWSYTFNTTIVIIPLKERRFFNLDSLLSGHLTLGVLLQQSLLPFRLSVLSWQDDLLYLSGLAWRCVDTLNHQWSLLHSCFHSHFNLVIFVVARPCYVQPLLGSGTLPSDRLVRNLLYEVIFWWSWSLHDVALRLVLPQLWGVVD